MSDPDPEVVLEFCQTCGTDPPLACKYLLLANNDLPQAISLFFDMGGTDLTDDINSTTASSAPLPENQSISSTSSSHLDQDLTHSRNPSSSTDSDLSSFWSSIHANVTDTIISSSNRSTPYPPPYPINSSIAPIPSRVNPFAQHPSRAYVPLGGGVDDNSANQLTERQSRLMELYRPPSELMYRGTFESAKEYGRMEKKWLVIDVNDDTQFPCQVLNRDIWKNPSVMEVIQELFVFLQIARHSDMGRQFIALYPIHRYPHVCIIDPRTGERTKEFTKAQLDSPASLVEALYEYIDRHSLSSHILPTNISKHSNSSNTITTTQTINDLPVSSSPMLDEEEKQLQLALQASLNHTTTTTEVIVLNDDDDEENNNNNNYHDKTSDHSHTSPQGRIISCTPLKDPEPTTGTPDTTRIQIRFPDGTRQVRRFPLSSLVIDLYRAVKTSLPDIFINQTNESPLFELIYIRQNLSEWLDRTIDECGLSNSSITMNYV